MIASYRRPVTGKHSKDAARFAPAGPGAGGAGVLTFHHPADKAPGPGVTHVWIWVRICLLLLSHSLGSFPRSRASGFSRMRTPAGASTLLSVKAEGKQAVKPGGAARGLASHLQPAVYNVTYSLSAQQENMVARHDSAAHFTSGGFHLQLNQ